MKKIYVFDTSVLVFDSNCFNKFPDSEIIIPIETLEELDKLKTYPSEVGKNARVFIKKLDELSLNGDIVKGVKLEHNILFKVDSNPRKAIFKDETYADNNILSCALSLKEKRKSSEVTLLTNDINLRVRARTLGLLASAYTAENIKIEDLYTGVQTLCYTSLSDELLKNKIAKVPDDLSSLYPNECLSLVNRDKSGACLARKCGDEIVLVEDLNPWGLELRNKEQALAADLLCDTSVPLVSLVGLPGSGKSIVSVASGLEMVFAQKKYSKLMFYRPIQPVGKDLGAIPGPQPLTAKILTPKGWTTMGELKVGDEVISRDGKPTKVLGVYPKGKKQVYKITTTDGTSTECCEDHLWYTQTFENKKRQKPGNVKSTKQIMNTFFANNGKLNHYLPRNEAVNFISSELPLPPYVLGCLLGDGSLGDGINISNIDQELIDRFSNEISKFGCSLTNSGKNIIFGIKSHLYNNKPAREVKITDINSGIEEIFPSIGIACLKYKDINRSTFHNRCENKAIVDGKKYEFLECKNRWQNPIKNEIHKLGLSGLHAWDKFIPNQYKYNSSINDRIALLQGLMDTDGTIKKNGEASFCTTSKKMALDLIEIVRGLGGRATLCSRNRVGKITIINNRKATTRRISYEFTVSLPKHINPFYISRKANRHKCEYMQKVGIKSIEPVGEKEVQCILVDNPEHLYITDDFIVTHNTLAEKLSVWYQPIWDAFDVIFSNRRGGKWKEQIDLWTEKGYLQFNAIAHIRGRSISDAFIVLDEAQNMSIEDIKTFLTRIGNNSKVVLTGDISQIDTKDLDAINNGLTHAVEKFKESDLAGHVMFQKGERSPLATEASKIL